MRNAPAVRPATFAAQQARAAHLVQRFAAEIAFAERLATMEGAPAARWPTLIAQARAIMAQAEGSGRLDRLEAGLTEAEALLAPIGERAKAHTVHCVGHAHIDMNWMWGWPETVAVTIDTFATVLTLMDEFPAFRFSQSQASVYEIVRRYCPEMLPRIRARVAEGRWEVAAAHWVEGDRNLAGGEALCRHLLYTRAFMREHLGLAPEDVTVDWSPDTFGHAATIPAIDASGAVRHLYCCRTGRTDRPPVFWWRAPDGSRILVNRETTWYINAPAPDHAQRLLDFRAATGLQEWMLVYGVGDHGGGPTRRDLRRLIDMDSWPIFPRWSFARSSDFFAVLEREGARWPTIDGELNYEFTGCYTSQTAIKRANRVGETLCADADAADALAWRAVGAAAPGTRLRDAWTDVLFGHFHDILPGSGVAATRHYSQGQLQRVQAEAGQVRAQSLRALAARVDTTFAGSAGGDETLSEHTSPALGGGVGRGGDALSGVGVVGDGPRPFVLVNPTAWPRREVLTVTVWEGDGAPGNGRVQDRAIAVIRPDGSAIGAQLLGSGNYWGHDFADYAVPVEVPAGGWTTVVVREQAAPAAAVGVELSCDQDGGHGKRSNLPSAELALQNEHLRVVVDRASGGITALVDRASGASFVDAAQPLGVLEYLRERPIGMSSWVLGDPAGAPQPLAIESIEPGRRGPYVASVIVRLRYGDSRFTATWTLHSGARRLELEIAGTWLERGGPDVGVPRLQLAMPTALSGAIARYEVPFGTVTRDDVSGREVPALRWAAVDGALPGGRSAGVALLNDGKHGHSLCGSTLRLNLIRSSYDPDPLPELGDHRMVIAIVPYVDRASDADLTRAAAEHNQPVAVVSTTVHAGPLPTRADGLSVDAPGVIVAAVKRSEDGAQLVVRLVENAGAKTTVRLAVPAAVYGRIAAASEADVLERPSARSTARIVGEAVSVELAAKGFTTVLVKLG